MTADPGLVAHWALPKRLPHDIKWLIVYVILSRVPSLKQLVSIGLTSKIRELIEGGPPEELVQTFSTLFEDKIEATKAAAKAARQCLEWSRPFRRMQCCKAYCRFERPLFPCAM